MTGLTLKQKREIVRRFFDGESLFDMARTMKGGMVHWGTDHMEEVLRDYKRGKFKLIPKRRRP